MEANITIILWALGGMTALIGGMFAAMGFMARRYVDRIERHLRNSHRVFGYLGHHELRIERVERTLKLPPLPKPKALEEEP